MIAPCGFRCDDCVAFAKNAKTHADRVRGSAAWARYYGLQVAPQRMQCHGCAAGKVEGLDFPDPKCEIRPCVLDRGLATCADCGEYPCKALESRMASCDEAVQRFRGHIPARDFARFIAPYDCRATLEAIRTRRAGSPGAVGRRQDRGDR
jgi:hypothetical protein